MPGKSSRLAGSSWHPLPWSKHPAMVPTPPHPTPRPLFCSPHPRRLPGLPSINHVCKHSYGAGQGWTLPSSARLLLCLEP